MTRSSEVPEGRAIQYSDLDAPGRRSLTQIMRERGNVASAVGGRIEHLQAAAERSTSPAEARKTAREATGLANVAPHLRDRPVTMRGAVDRRVSHFTAGIERQAAEGSDPGGGWYFSHHESIARSAEQHGVEPHRAITAAAAMSPMNSPTNERAAVTGLMRQRAGDTSPDVPTQVQRGGTKKNIAKAEEHLAGGPDPLDPLSAPKVHSYREATVNATPGGAVHEEYLTRLGHASKVIQGELHPGQQRMDLFGLQDSREGILNPAGNTAEDTWMNTITYGQDVTTSVGEKGRTNVGKTIASDKRLALDIGKRPAAGGESVHPSGQVGSSAALHAYNNEATIRAARKVGEATGTVDSSGASNLPSVAMQEVSWTEVRRAAGKDPEYRASRSSAVDGVVSGQLKGQQVMRGPGFDR